MAIGLAGGVAGAQGRNALGAAMSDVADTASAVTDIKCSSGRAGTA